MKRSNFPAGLLFITAIFFSCSKNSEKPVVPSSSTTVLKTNATRLYVSPSIGIVYSAVTITGSNFDGVAANNVVTFNGVTATVISASTTQLVVTVPKGATTGRIKVKGNGTTVTSPANFQVLQLVKTGSLLNNSNITITSLITDKNGNIYGVGSRLSNTEVNFVFRYQNGVLKHLFNTPDQQSKVWWLGNLVLDSHNNIFVGESYFDAGGSRGGMQDSAKIIKITPDQKVSIFAGGTPGLKNSDQSLTGNQLVFNLAIDSSDNIFATTNQYRGNIILRKITPAAVVATVPNVTINGGKFVFDKLGNLYYSSYNTDGYYIVQKMDLEGIVTTLLNTGDSHITSLFTDVYNNVFVCTGAPLNKTYIINTAGAINSLPTGGDLLLNDNAGNFYMVGKYITRYTFR